MENKIPEITVNLTTKKVEGKAIKVRGHITGGARVTIEIPGASDFWRLFKNPEIFHRSDEKTESYFPPGKRYDCPQFPTENFFPCHIGEAIFSIASSPCAE